MDRGLFIAASTASSLMNKQALVAQNMANINTTGFKKLMEQQVSWNIPDQKSNTDLNTRTYAPEVTSALDLSEGTLIKTDDPLHIALPQQLYLSVNMGNDQEAFTKRGDMTRDSAGILRLSSGQEVMANGGGNIVIPENMSASIAQDGTVFAMSPSDPKNRVELGKIKIVKSPDTEVSLRPDGFLNLKNPEELNENIHIKNGVLEQSNVSASEVMAKMLETSRLYDFNTKLVNAFNAAEQKGNELLSNWQ